MTISSTIRKAGPFPGNGSTVALPFTFKVFTAADVLAVKAVTATGAETALTLGTDYTVSLNADQDAMPGGTLTLVTAHATGTTVTLTTQIENTQGTDLTNLGGFYPKVINDALDRATIQIQQLAEKLSRVLTFGLSSGASGSLPNPTPLGLLGWNAAGTALQNFVGAASASVSTFMANVVAAVDEAAAQTALGATAVGRAVFAAANAAAARLAIGAAASGANNDITSLGSLGSINGGQLAGLRNLLINGNFPVNQRSYVSGTATVGANQYTLDRWRVVVSGQSLTFSASGNGNAITAPAGGVEQVIEGVNISGGTYVLNWTGTATATVNGTARAKGESFTLPANTNATVRLIGGTASLVQLEPGTTPTPFEHGPLWLEEARGQRYCQPVAGISAGGYQNAGAAVVVTVNFKVRMRAAPTVTITNNGSLINSSSTPVYSPSVDGFGFGVVALTTGPTFATGAQALAVAEL